MIHPRTLTITAAAALLCAAAAFSQRGEKRASPHETTSATIAGKKISITYGRPYMKGRKIFGGLEQYGKVWRTGADEATKLTTDGTLTLGTLTVPPGSYSLFTIPGEKDWKLVINKVADQWGAYKYDAAQDLGRVDMKVEKPATPVEQLTISLDETGGNKGVLKIAWENTVASVPVTVK